ncbi:MAG: hypothetical protein ABIK83_15725 [Candidatus Zixiibacteriota bacterium]
MTYVLLRHLISAILILGSIASAQTVVPPRQRSTVTESVYTKGRAVIREGGFDFGKVPQNAFVSKKFYLINMGSDTLEVLKVDPG